MKHLMTLCLVNLFVQFTNAQDSTDLKKYKSPYKTSFRKRCTSNCRGGWINCPWCFSYSGKKDLTMAELMSKAKDDVIFFDRGSAGNYSEKANDDSYIPFYGSFAMPVVMGLILKNQRNKFGQIMVLYTQTMAITSSMFTIAAGAINRSRPLVYGTKASQDLRMAGKSQRSFYAGHTAASAAASFFAAKVFQDFYPDSKAKPYVWFVAATVPAITGYLRYKAGYHFLSDNILGYVIGAGTGLLIPKMHRNKTLNNITIVPEAGNNYKGISFTYYF